MGAPLRVLVLCTTLVATIAYCPVSHWEEFESNCYWMSNYKTTFEEANDACWVGRGYLASLHDLTTSAFVASRLADSWRQAWIGLHKYENWGNATWTDHSAVDFYYWDSANSTMNGTANGNLTEWGAYVNSNDITGQWGIATLDTALYFVCQMDY